MERGGRGGCLPPTVLESLCARPTSLFLGISLWLRLESDFYLLSPIFNLIECLVSLHSLEETSVNILPICLQIVFNLRLKGKGLRGARRKKLTLSDDAI